MKIISTFLIALGCIVLGSAGLAYYFYLDFAKKPASRESKQVIYEIRTGDSFMKIANELESAGVIRSASFFNIYARMIGERSQVKAGEYELNTRMTPSQVLQTITSGRSLARPFTISEGLNIFEIAQMIEAKGLGTSSEFLRLIRNPELIKDLLGPEAVSENIMSLEGYLFPETYMLTKYMQTSDLVKQMTRRFLAVWNEVSINHPRPRRQMTRHERVTLASLIEKETGASHERKLVSSVFHNRMDKGMKLQTDPSILYGLSILAGRQIMSIRRVDIRRPTIYNTYVIKGLPPGPVANPGREALDAAFAPQSSNYLFFVSRNDGTSVFSAEYKDHRAAVQKFQIDPAGREGKSWRDLKAKPGGAPAPAPAPVPAGRVRD